MEESASRYGGYQTADNGWSSTWGIGRGANNFSPSNYFVTKCHKMKERDHQENLEVGDRIINSDLLTHSGFLYKPQY
jgi:hypothetical protein